MTDTTATDDRSAHDIAGWREELTGIGGPNTLLWFDDRGRGMLELTTAHPAGVARLFSSGSARLSQVVRESYAYAEASRRLRMIEAKVVELQEDRGIDSCWMGIGLAGWKVRGSGTPPLAPVLLRRVRLQRVAGHPDDLLIEVTSPAIVNPALVAYLRQAYGIEVDEDALTALARASSPSDPRQVFDELRRACTAVPGFEIQRRQIISTFNLSKADLVGDLMDEHAPGHPVLDALSGDPDALEAIRAVPPEPDPTGLAEAHGVLASDASQEAVLSAVLAGAHLTVDGAPGTGKTQTIANLVAALAAQGRPMLLVSHKRAAIEAVNSRLTEVGLGDLVAHMSDGRPGPEFEELFNRRIQEAIASSAQPPAVQRNPSVFAQKLQEHHQRMHRLHSPWQVSLAQTLEAITALGDRRPSPRSHVRLAGGDLLALSPAQRDEAGRRLLTIARKGAWPTSGENDPWYGAAIAGPQQAQRTRDSVTELANERLGAHRALVEDLFDQVGLPSPADMREEEECLELLQHVTDTLEVFRPEVFEAPLGDLAAATGDRHYRREHDSTVGVMERRRLVAQAQELLRPGPRPDLHGVLVQALRQRVTWRRIAGKGSRPAAPKGLADVVAAHEKMRSELEWLGQRLSTTADGGDLLDQSFDSLQARLGRLSHSIERLGVIPEVTADIDALRAQGLGDLVDELAHRQVSPDEVVPELEFVWWTSLFAHLHDPAEGTDAGGQQIRDLLHQYAADEQERRAERAGFVRAKLDERLRFVVRNLPEQVRDVQQGLARGASLRDLLPAAPELMMALMPCWAMSPLLVPAHVPAGVWFDVVAIDEASRMSTAEAVPAVRRGAQTVLFGDRRQLRPSRFAVDAARTPAGARPTPSILDELTGLVPAIELGTHYRSRDGRLFDFANIQAYGAKVRTFPAPTDGRVIRLDITAAGQDELDRVVDVVSSHAARPGRGSLMVVALTDEHAERLNAQLARRAVTDPGVRALLEENSAEAFIVRTAERAQGFTRDVVVLSTGCRVDEDGGLVGAVARVLDDGGERALLVATTRAREQLVVVSAFRADDVAVAGLHSRGAQMYRDLLVHAATGGGAERTAGPPGSAGKSKQSRRRRTASTGSVLDRPLSKPVDEPAHPCIGDLARRLRGEGLTVRPGAGTSRPAVDLVIVEGEPLVVDTDAVALAELGNVRDRDLVRPAQLRARGWRYERLALGEVFSDPAQQIARLAEVATRTQDGA